MAVYQKKKQTKKTLKSVAASLSIVNFFFINQTSSPIPINIPM
jgi:hypothetical protein